MIFLEKLFSLTAIGGGLLLSISLWYLSYFSFRNGLKLRSLFFFLAGTAIALIVYRDFLISL